MKNTKKESNKVENTVPAKTLTYRDVIKKYFTYDDRMLYFTSSDSLKTIEGNVYLTYRQRDYDHVELYFGSDNGETCIRVCYKPEQLDALIKAIIY